MRRQSSERSPGRGADVDGLEERIVATLDRFTRELRSIRLRQQAECAFLDALVKTTLTYLVEFPAMHTIKPSAVACGRARSERCLKIVEIGMTGDSQVAITELMKRVEEE